MTIGLVGVSVAVQRVTGVLGLNIGATGVVAVSLRDITLSTTALRDRFSTTALGSRFSTIALRDRFATTTTPGRFATTQINPRFTTTPEE